VADEHVTASVAILALEHRATDPSQEAQQGCRPAAGFNILNVLQKQRLMQQFKISAVPQQIAL
jgi:hypothetical protein